MIPDSIIETAGPVVESVAADIARRYWTYGCDQADLSQEGWVWVYQHPEHMLRWFDPEQYSEESAIRLLAKSLRRACVNYGEDLKAAKLGYSREDLVYYSKQGLHPLLDAMFDPEAWLKPEQDSIDSERRQKSAPAEGGNWLATLADVAQGFTKLTTEDQALLRMFHEKPAWRNKDAADYFKISEATMSYRHDRAIGRLLNQLGGPRPKSSHDEDCGHWSGGRVAMSNAHARAVTDDQWDEA